jgi:hypothetical protein
MATVKKPKTRTTMQGRFIPKFPAKYVGNPDAIFFRSSWEYRFMIWADQNNAVLRWASEEIAIPYVNPIKKDLSGNHKISRYYPDFIIMVRKPDGTVTKTIVEIKPKKESVLTEKSSDRDKMAFIVNQTKWAAARAYAARNNAEFAVVTEEQLFWKGPEKKPAPRKARVKK